MGKKVASITDIQRYSVHDGPGIRTTVFFLGCPLRCEWCQNPETQSLEPSFAYFKKNCVFCGKCSLNCPNHAITLTEQGIKHNPKFCNQCGLCTKICNYRAIVFYGYKIGLNELFNFLLRDESFYECSGGGITLSGGEILSQYKFATEILSLVKQRGIQTAIETCGFASWEVLEKILLFTDLVLYDIKHINPLIHKQFTGFSNELILENLRKTVKLQKRVVVRVPFIPGVNDSEADLQSLASIILEIGINTVHLLPFHQFGQSKWEALGKKYTFASCLIPDEKKIAKATELLGNFGLRVNVGGFEKY
jgi:pyruvate formate lyase activating enzyme